MTSPFYGPKLFYADDPAGEWEQADGVALPEGGDAALERIWVIVPGEADGVVYAGGDPGVLFESRDGGATFELNRGLWEHPTRPSWQPGAGGLCLHSIVHLAGRAGPAGGRDLRRRRVADRRRRRDVAQRQRRASSRATCPRTRPPTRSRSACTACAARRRGPSGCSCSSTAASIAPTTPARRGPTSARGLPSDFGFPLALDPADPDSAYVIPLVADVDRVTPDGRVRVYETRDAGASWTAARRRPAAASTPT